MAMQTCNICFNPFVYRQFFHKVDRIGAYSLEFMSHKKNLQCIEPPSKEFGFDDSNTALVNTMEILQNQAPVKPSITKEDIVSIVKNYIENGTIS